MQGKSMNRFILDAIAKECSTLRPVIALKPKNSKSPHSLLLGSGWGSYIIMYSRLQSILAEVTAFPHGDKIIVRDHNMIQQHNL